MQRRLNLAAATIHQPSVLLLDEPTVGVDPQSRSHIFGCIEELKRRRVSIVYSTHYLEEAERLCDSIAIIDHGRILAFGSCDELVERFGTAPVPTPPSRLEAVFLNLTGRSLRDD
jgi:ABC-2 type transport system ATP-binding protein